MDKLLSNLRAVVGRDAVLSEPDELLVYECDGLTHYRERPRAVVFPRSTDEVSEVLRVLARERVPFAPRGAGTGLSGGALALNQGVTIELARMRRLLKLDLENRLAVVEVGMVNAQLSRAVAKAGLYYAPDPSSQASCTIGGNIAENAGGIHCLKYGTTTDHVVGARVVLSDGQIIELGGAGTERAGYDLLGVFVGSEGTFGIATEATLRLLPIPPAVRTMLADFIDINDASRAVSAIIAAGIIPAALEMVDGATIRAVEASVFAAGLPLDAAGALLVELDGLEAGIDEETARVQSICLAHGARQCRLAADERERKKLWAARKGAFGAMGRVAPDMLIQDAVVPRSRLPEVLAATYRISAKYRLRIANVFHAGDGNLHPFISFDSRDADEVARVQEAGREIMETCVRAGGTITGEHGVGLDKSAYLPLIFSDDDLRAMLRVRAAFDPSGLCNPGKVIPVLKGCGESRSALPRDGASKRAEVVTGETLTASSDISKQLKTLYPQQVSSSSWRYPRIFTHEQAFNACAQVVGREHVGNFNDDGDALIVSPSSADEVCEFLRMAETDELKVVPAGSSTWLDAGDVSSNQISHASGSVPSIILRTTRMNRILEHEPADLVATTEAGVALADFNREVGCAGQWLALDPPDGGGALTLGGIAATGLGGAQSFDYGAPRAHVLGMTVALAGGKLIRVGGRVVKNVAGYDLCKLFVGSYGTLGVILDLTFKLRPRPDSEATIVALANDIEPLITAARAIAAASLLPVAIELLSPGTAATLEVSGDDTESYVLLIRFAGTAESVADQTDRAREIVRRHVGRGTVEVVGDDARLWTALASRRLRREETIAWRACVRPGDLGLLLAEVKNVCGENDIYRWQASAGSGRLRLFDSTEANDVAQVSRLQRLRDFARGAGGSLVIEHAPNSLKRKLGAWGLDAPTASLMRRVKQQLDPGDVFSPGRFASAPES